MEALIPIQKSAGGRDVVSARTLHQFLEVSSKFTDWWARRLTDYPCFEENSDFCSFLSESTGGRPAEDFVITLDMAKELSMVERNEKGQQARRYFIACEKQLRGLVEAPRPLLPTTYREALAALLMEVEQKEQLEQQLALAAPKLAFVQSIEASTNSLSFKAAAQTLKIPGLEGRNKLIARLKADKILQSSREPYQRYVDAGYFEREPQTYTAGQKGQRVTGTTRVTPRGLKWLASKYNGTDNK